MIQRLIQLIMEPLSLGAERLIRGIIYDNSQEIVIAHKGKYDEYGGSREFLLSLTKAISRAANVSIIRVNGMRVSVLGYACSYMLVHTLFKKLLIGLARA